MFTKLFNKKRCITLCFATILIAIGTMSTINTKASTNNCVPQKVVCKKDIERAVILKKPSKAAEETGYYVYSGLRYELLSMDGNYYCIEYYDNNGNAKKGYCEACNFIYTPTTLAIDVSHYQGDINWSEVSKTEIEGRLVKTAMIKVGQTSKKYMRYSFNSNEANASSEYSCVSDEFVALASEPNALVAVEDERFKKNVTYASEHGIEVGVYFYSKASSVAQAQEEAQWVIDRIKEYNITAPVAFDYEDNSVNELSSQAKTDICKAFLDYINSSGYEAVLYSNQNYLLTKLQMDKLNKYYVWAARYSTKKPILNNTIMWQYTDKGNVAGIDGDVDLSWRY